MNRTNSNSITSILIFALNNKKSPFRNKILKEKFGIDSNENLCFYDGTHNPLLIPGMKNKQVDIYAREIGKYKVTLMIEIKANLHEILRQSQGKKGEYLMVSEHYGIPLFYIIPRQYYHKEGIPKGIIEWEEILEIAEACKDKTGLSEQIRNFVDLNENKIVFGNQEKQYFTNLTKLGKVLAKRDLFKNDILNSLSKGAKFPTEENSYELGAYWNNNSFFLGYSYMYKDFNDTKGKPVFMLTVAENKNNMILGDKGFYYYEGWYYIPIKIIPGFENQKTIDDLKDKDIKPSIYGNIDIKKIKQLEMDNNIPIINNFIDNIKLLCNEKSIMNKFKPISRFEITKDWFGCYYTKKNSKKENIFIGYDTKDESSPIDLTIQYNKNDWEKYSLKQIQPKFYEEFINSKTEEEYIKNFGQLIDEALKFLK